MKILITIATHGNEKIGFLVAKELTNLDIPKKNLVIQVANEKAFKLNERYIDQDLNRSFPGKKKGNYEQQLAYKLLPTIKKADLVIDIHSTTSDLRDALIVTKLNKKTREYINIIGPKYVLLMSATKNNALISGAKIGIAFEYGKDKDPITVRKVTTGIKRLLNHLEILDVVISKPKSKLQYFNVIKTVSKPKGYQLLKNIKNYKLVKKGQVYAKNGKSLLIAKKDFYPILFGQKNYGDIFGFKGKILNKKRPR